MSNLVDDSPAIGRAAATSRCAECGGELSGSGVCEECMRAHRLRIGMMFFLVLPIVGGSLLFLIAPMGMPGSDAMGAIGGGLACLSPIIGLICIFAPPATRTSE